MRNLAYVVVETGLCLHCGKEAGFHAAADGICSPHRDPHGPMVRADVPRTCYRGTEQHAFIDVETPEARVLARRVLGLDVRLHQAG
jgi:hypothetical protein